MSHPDELIGDEKLIVWHAEVMTGVAELRSRLPEGAGVEETVHSLFEVLFEAADRAEIDRDAFTRLLAEGWEWRKRGPVADG